MSLPLPDSPEPQWPVPPAPKHEPPQPMPPVGPNGPPAVPEAPRPDDPMPACGCAGAMRTSPIPGAVSPSATVRPLRVASFLTCGYCI